jgi:hypothetical protein
MWTLIVTLTLMPDWSAEAAGSTSGYSVYGFQTEKACIDAGESVPSPKSNNYVRGNATFTCVKM